MIVLWKRDDEAYQDRAIEKVFHRHRVFEYEEADWSVQHSEGALIDQFGGELCGALYNRAAKMIWGIEFP